MPSVTQIQGGSALVFGTYAVFHFLNSATAALGPQAYNAFQDIGRVLYHNKIGEGILLGSLAVHIGASAYRMVQRWRRPGPAVKATWKMWAHRVAGYITTFFVGAHVYACRFEHGIGPRFEGLSFLARHDLFKLVLVPYLTLFGTAGIVHLFIGVPTALGYVGVPFTNPVTKISRDKTFQKIAIGSFAIGLYAGLYGLMGGFDRDLPSFADNEYVQRLKAGGAFDYNTMIGALGEESYDWYQEQVRKVYQNPVGEAITLVSLAIHCVASSLKMLKRKRQAPASKKTETQWSKSIHAWTGYLMMVIVVPHIFVTRFDHHSPMFAGLSFVTRNRFFRLMILPYFTLYGAAGIIHMFLGLPSAFKLMGWYKAGSWIQKNLPLRVLTVLCVIGVEVGVAGMMGLITELNSDYSDSPFALSHAALADGLWESLSPVFTPLGIPHWRNF